MRERDHSEDPGLDWRIILKWIFRKWNRSMDWIDLALNRDMWLAKFYILLTVHHVMILGK